ncbi:MAG: hemolysin family protein [Pseudomonadota bacterium]
MPAPSAVERLWNRLARLWRQRGAEAALRDTIEEIIEEGKVPPEHIGVEERALLRNIFRLREASVHDVMVPQADIVAVAHDIPLSDLVAFMVREGHSRLPVYRESRDDIVGMVHIKDMLPLWGGDKPFRLNDILRKVLFVAPSMPVLDLLLEMRRTRIHMALVVDEYGGIDGIVTIEDLVEEIVGEIEDEHDVEPGPRLVRESDGSLIADARLPISEFEAEVGPVLTEEERRADINTLGGLVVAQAGRLPGRGEVIAHRAGFEFEVLEVDTRRLKRLKVRRARRRPAPASEP